MDWLFSISAPAIITRFVKNQYIQYIRYYKDTRPDYVKKERHTLIEDPNQPFFCNQNTAPAFVIEGYKYLPILLDENLSSLDLTEEKKHHLRIARDRA